MGNTEYVQIEDLLAGRVKLLPPDAAMYARIRSNWDRIAKPLDGMGAFEDLTARIGAIQGQELPALKKRCILIMIADNGIVEEGVSQSGQEVTLAVARSMGQGRSSVGRMAAVTGTETMPVDIGINSTEEIPGVLKRKVRPGTRNFAREAAMTREEVLEALQVGMDLAADCRKADYRILGTGEMGIGNTTTSSALAAALLDLTAEETTGRGAGLDDRGLARKQRVIEDALCRYRLREKDPLTILETVGGLDIAGLAGVMIGGACCHMPIVLDGVISVVAALVACRLFPVVRDYLIPSHASREIAAARMLEELSLRPVLYGDMALGEGTGAVMLFPLLETALALYEDRTTFSDIDIDAYRRFDHSTEI